MSTYPTILTTGEVGTDFNSQTMFGNDACLDIQSSPIQYVNLGTGTSNPNLNNLNEMTCSFYLKITGNGFAEGGSSQRSVLNIGAYRNNNISPRPKFYVIYFPLSGVINFIVEGSTLDLGVSTSIKFNIWEFYTFTFNPGVSANLYKNGVSVSSNPTTLTILNTQTTAASIVGLDSFGSYNAVNGFGNSLRKGQFQIANLVYFNKALTDFEVLNLYNSNGQPQQSLHANVVAHYPLAQRESYIVQAGDEALNKGLSVGDYAVWDVSEQYNYAKTTPITAQHGKLVNYNTDEVGVDSLQNTTSFRNFYCSDVRYSPIRKKYIKAQLEYDEIINFAHFDRLTPITYIFNLKLTQLSGNNISFSNMTSSDPPDDKGIQLQFLNTLFQLNYLNSINNRIVINYNFDFTKNNIVIITYDGSSNASGFNVYINGTIINGSIVNNNLTQTILPTQPNFYINNRIAGNLIGDGFIENFEILNSDKSSDLAFIDHVSKCGSAYGYVPNSEFLLAIDFSKNDGQLSTLPNTPSYTIQANKNGSNFTPQIGDGTYVEAKTELPPLVECLYLTGTQFVDYSAINLPNSSEDFTFTCLVKTNQIESGLSALAKFIENYFVIFSGLAAKESGEPGYLVSRLLVKTPTTSNNYKFNCSNFNGTTTSFNLYNSISGDDRPLTMITLIKRKDITESWFNSALITKLPSLNESYNIGNLRSGYVEYDSAASVSDVNFYLTSFGYWKRALEPWEIKELYNNQAIYGGNPYAWNNSQGTGFQDQLEIWHQFQSNSIYWDGSNYRVTNYGSGADATLGNYATSGLNQFTTDNPNSIVKINSLR